MLRPRESRELRLVSHEVTVTPAASVTWAHDVFGNAVATASFEEPDRPAGGRQRGEARLWAVDPWPVFDIAAVAVTYPFAYTSADLDATSARWWCRNIPIPTAMLLGLGQGLRAQRPDRHAVAA